MTAITRQPNIPYRFNRSYAFAALMGAALLASPFSAAHAQTQAGSKANTAETKAAVQEDNIDRRISTLHTRLQITAAEEPAWSAVADTMRENAAGMAKLAASANTVKPTDMTAVQDMQTYETLAHAHVDGLQKLLVSFTALYNQMPPAQQKVADQVFQQSHVPPAGKQTP